MRSSFRLATLLAALTAVLVLAGCAEPAPLAVPTTPAGVAAIDLVPVIWRVRDAAGEPDRTWVRFQPGVVDVFRPKGFIDLSWSVQGSAISTLISDWSGSLGGMPSVRWLTAATRFERDGAGWRLVDADGTVTARLARDGTPPTSANWETNEPVVDARARAALADAVPGAGVLPLASDTIVGRWGVKGHPSSIPSITFTAEGRWSAAVSCRTGTNDGTGGGGYRLLPTGMLLMTAGAVAGVGCSAPKTPLWSTSGVKAINGMARARSVRIDGTTATFYDHAGVLIGSLVRQTP